MGLSRRRLPRLGDGRKNLVQKSGYKMQNVETAPTAVSTLRQLRGQDLNLRPSGYEPDELPDCSTPR